MLSLDTMIIFFGINLSLCLMPTPEMVKVVTHSTLQGKNAGIAVVTGVCSALVIQVVLLAFGLTALIQTSEIVFISLKVVGVVYLLYLASQAFLQPDNISVKGVEQYSLFTLYRQGFVLNISNPMNPLFLLVFFPPFLESGNTSFISQILQLGVIMIVAALIMFVLMSFLSEIAGKKLLKTSQFRRLLNIGAGTTITGFAVYLAWAEQSLS